MVKTRQRSIPEQKIIPVGLLWPQVLTIPLQSAPNLLTALPPQAVPTTMRHSTTVTSWARRLRTLITPQERNATCMWCLCPTALPSSITGSVLTLIRVHGTTGYRAQVMMLQVEATAISTTATVIKTGGLRPSRVTPAASTPSSTRLRILLIPIRI